jgi:hypothetical protein
MPTFNGPSVLLYPNDELVPAASAATKPQGVGLRRLCDRAATIVAWRDKSGPPSKRPSRVASEYREKGGTHFPVVRLPADTSQYPVLELVDFLAQNIGRSPWFVRTAKNTPHHCASLSSIERDGQHRILSPQGHPSERTPFGAVSVGGCRLLANNALGRPLLEENVDCCCTAHEVCH